jgi:hypothetical protein
MNTAQMTNDQAKSKMQMIHVILVGAEAQRNLRSQENIAEVEAKMATIGEKIPTDVEVLASLQRAFDMLRELSIINLTPSAKRLVQTLVTRYRNEMNIRKNQWSNI